MKNVFLVLLVLVTGSVIAQDSTFKLRSKQGEPILPEAGDWGLGIDATRFIKDVDFNFFSQAQNITVKYMKNATTVYRLGARIGYNQWTSKAMVTDRVAATNSVIAYPAAVPQKQNTWQRSAFTFGLSGGIEKRRGKGRLQGLYGAEGGIYFSTLKDKFTYGNNLNASSLERVVVDSTDGMSSSFFGSANNIVSNAPIQGVTGDARSIERKSGLMFSIGARAFAGVEYYFLPKMSVGGEFGWGVSVTTGGRSVEILESIGQSNIQGNTTPAVKRTTIDGGTESSIRIDTDNTNMIGGMSATLRLSVYF